MTKIDIHHHLVAEHGYINRLLRAMDRLEIGRCGLIGLGRLFEGLFVMRDGDGRAPDDDDVAGAVADHPQRFFGYRFVRLGHDGPEAVDEAVERGFAALKFHVPTHPYDDERFFPVYHRAMQAGLPCLFHTGIVALPRPKPGCRIRSRYMSVMHLEGVAQEFPELTIVMAHFGVQEAEAAAALVRIVPSMYADLSGSMPGWRARWRDDDWRQLLWWEGSHRKVLFGSDVNARELDAATDYQQRIYDAVGWSDDEQAEVWSGNARRLFGIT